MLFIDFRERKGGKKGGERDTHMDVREKHRLVASHTLLTGIEPWYVPWVETKPTTFSAYGIMLQPAEPPDWGWPFLFLMSIRLYHVVILFFYIKQLNLF